MHTLTRRQTTPANSWLFHTDWNKKWKHGEFLGWINFALYKNVGLMASI